MHGSQEEEIQVYWFSITNVAPVDSGSSGNARHLLSRWPVPQKNSFDSMEIKQDIKTWTKSGQKALKASWVVTHPKTAMDLLQTGWMLLPQF